MCVRVDREPQRERERRGGESVGRECMNSLTLSSSHYPAVLAVTVQIRTVYIKLYQPIYSNSLT